MNESRLRPKVVLWWGVGLTAGALLLMTLFTQFSYGVINAASGEIPVGLMVTDVVLRILTQLVAPLGVVLIGASVVMAYVARLVGARVPADEKGAAPVE